MNIRLLITYTKKPLFICVFVYLRACLVVQQPSCQLQTAQVLVSG